MIKRVVLGVLAIAFIVWAYWFFIGPAFTTQRVEEAMPDRMDVLKTGTFTVIDGVHKGSGTAKVVFSGGKYYVVLEDFKVTNGPDLYLYLSEGRDVMDEDELGAFRVVSRLKGNEGNQVYEITKEDAESFSSVVIWCKRFGVLFSSATLS